VKHHFILVPVDHFVVLKQQRMYYKNGLLDLSS